MKVFLIKYGVILGAGALLLVALVGWGLTSVERSADVASQEELRAQLINELTLSQNDLDQRHGDLVRTASGLDVQRKAIDDAAAQGVKLSLDAVNIETFSSRVVSIDGSIYRYFALVETEPGKYAALNYVTKTPGTLSSITIHPPTGEALRSPLSN